MSAPASSPAIHAGPVRRHQWFSPLRILTLAGGTFTQLVRMKVFYFMAIFAIAVIAASFAFADLQSDGQLKLLKDVSLASMSLFSMLFAIAGTALLIPRDIEDRTLYTILCKPVPRLEYLLGKLLGMVFLIFISLVLMNILFSAVLYLKEQAVLGQQISILEERFQKGHFATREALEANIADVQESMLGQGLNWSLQFGVLAIFFKATVLTGVTLFVSTFASSTIFTIMTSLAVMVIGQAQSIARDVVMGHDATLIPRLIAGAVSLLFPDFKNFDIVDAAIAGAAIPAVVMAKMAGLTLVYLTIHLMAAYFIFSDKEL
jgi:hypothetical protein